MSHIIVQNISKKFRIGQTPKGGVLSTVFSFFSGKESKKDLWVLRDLSITVSSGEIIGIVGDNGVGKSTFLSLLAGIYSPTNGSIQTSGKVVPLIGLGSAFIDRLSMRDNIYLFATLLGLNKKTIYRRFDEIVRLSGLSEYTDTKLYQFSLGMLSRLAFSIAMYSDPKILLFDEVTNNMDDTYADKALKLITEAARRGVIVFIVSHRPDIIKNCNRVIWLGHNSFFKIGSPSQIIKEYWDF